MCFPQFAPHPTSTCLPCSKMADADQGPKGSKRDSRPPSLPPVPPPAPPPPPLPPPLPPAPPAPPVPPPPPLARDLVDKRHGRDASAQSKRAPASVSATEEGRRVTAPWKDRYFPPMERYLTSYAAVMPLQKLVRNGACGCAAADETLRNGAYLHEPSFLNARL